MHRQLWDILLLDDLRSKYCTVIEQGKFLLGIERNGMLMTLNSHFQDTVNNIRSNRILRVVDKSTEKITTFKDTWYNMQYVEVNSVALEKVKACTADMSNSELVCDDLLNIVERYYKVARERFVDTVCQHVVYHMLLTSPDSPLHILSPDHIMQMSAEKVEAIAGEDTITLNQRHVLKRQLDSLDETMKVMRI